MSSSNIRRWHYRSSEPFLSSEHEVYCCNSSFFVQRLSRHPAVELEMLHHAQLNPSRPYRHGHPSINWDAKQNWHDGPPATQDYVLV